MMAHSAQLDLPSLHRVKIVAPVLAVVVAAVAALSVTGAQKSWDLRAATAEIAQPAAIDIWQLHLQADMEHMPLLTIAELV